MLAKKRDGLQIEPVVDVARDYHKVRYRPYRQSNSLSSKSLLDINLAEPPKEGYTTSHSPNHLHQPHHQTATTTTNNNNNNNSNNQGNEQYQNHHHYQHHQHHHQHHHQGSRLSRGSTHDIPDGRTSPATVDLSRRERRMLNNKRSNSLFTPNVTQIQQLDNASPRGGQISAPTTPTVPVSLTPTAITTPTPLPVSPDTAAASAILTVTPPEYGSDRRKMLIQQRRNNGQFAAHGSIYTYSDVGHIPKNSGFSSQSQYHGHNQSSQHQSYQTVVGKNDPYNCHNNGNDVIRRGSDRTPKGVKIAASITKRAEKERPLEKTRPNSCSGSRECSSRNSSFATDSEQGNGFSRIAIEGNKKHGGKSGRNTPSVSESGTSIKVTDPTDPGGGQNNGVISKRYYQGQQRGIPHYQQKEETNQRAPRTNGKVRANEGHLVKEPLNRCANPLGSLMKWEYEDLYGHMNKNSGDRMTPARSIRPKSAGVSARTHTAMIDSDDSSLDGDIEYVDLEELSDGEDAIVMTDSELAAAASSYTSSKQRVPKSWKDSNGNSGGGGGGGCAGGGVGIRRAYSMKDNQANSFTKDNSRHVNKISQESRRLRCSDSKDGKPGTKWMFTEKNTQHSNYQKPSRRENHLRVGDSTDTLSNNSYHRHSHVKKDMFDMSSFKDNLSFSQTESLATKCKKLGNGKICFSVTGEQLAPEGLRQLKNRHCGLDATEPLRSEKGETLPRRNFPRRLKPLFGNIVEDSES